MRGRIKNPNCNHCGIPFTKDNCYQQKTRSGDFRPYSTCKKCHSKLVVERWIELKKRVVEQMGGRCADCQGVFSYELYDLHHLVPKEKEYNWGKIKLFSEERRQAELNKCVLLCANCHRKRHLLFEETFSPVSQRVKSDGFCKKCGAELLEGSVYLRQGKPDCLCKTCRNKGCSENQRKRKRDLVLEMGAHCFNCKEKFDPRIYDMHHLVPIDKNGSVKFTRSSKDATTSEMEKCVLLCPNCHRLRHKEMRTS